MQLAWSYVMDIELYNNPFEDRRVAILDWKKYLVTDTAENEKILEYAEYFSKRKIRNLDSLHLACAIYTDCDYFITTDDDLIKRYSYNGKMQVVNPIDFIKVMEEAQ